MIRRGALSIRGSKDRKLFYLPASMAGALGLALFEGGIGGLQLGHEVAALPFQVREAPQYIRHR